MLEKRKEMACVRNYLFRLPYPKTHLHRFDVRISEKKVLQVYTFLTKKEKKE
jgi:hypothetical protein